jgi:hypothetical protein
MAGQVVSPVFYHHKPGLSRRTKLTIQQEPLAISGYIITPAAVPGHLQLGIEEFDRRTGFEVGSGRHWKGQKIPSAEVK